MTFPVRYAQTGRKDQAAAIYQRILMSDQDRFAAIPSGEGRSVRRWPNVASTWFKARTEGSQLCSAAWLPSPGAYPGGKTSHNVIPLSL